MKNAAFSKKSSFRTIYLTWLFLVRNYIHKFYYNNDHLITFETYLRPFSTIAVKLQLVMPKTNKKDKIEKFTRQLLKVVIFLKVVISDICFCFWHKLFYTINKYKKREFFGIY